MVLPNIPGGPSATPLSRIFLLPQTYVGAGIRSCYWQCWKILSWHTHRVGLFFIYYNQLISRPTCCEMASKRQSAKARVLPVQKHCYKHQGLVFLRSSQSQRSHNSWGVYMGQNRDESAGEMVVSASQAELNGNEACVLPPNPTFPKGPVIINSCVRRGGTWKNLQNSPSQVEQSRQRVII